MNEKDYSDKLLKVQKDYMKCQHGMMEVMIQMKDTLVQINDQNVLHNSKDDARYDTIERLISAVESRSKVMNSIFYVVILAIVVLAGAEKVLQFI
jgi:hypothetical protein